MCFLIKNNLVSWPPPFCNSIFTPAPMGKPNLCSLHQLLSNTKPRWSWKWTWLALPSLADDILSTCSMIWGQQVSLTVSRICWFYMYLSFYSFILYKFSQFHDFSIPWKMQFWIPYFSKFSMLHGYPATSNRFVSWFLPGNTVVVQISYMLWLLGY